MARKKIEENFEKMRQLIIGAAVEVMVKGSITRFSMTEVAEAAGITKAAIYWYFSGKDALVEAAIGSVYDTYLGYAEAIAGGQMSCLDKLHRIVVGEADTVQGVIMCMFPVKFYLEVYSKDCAVRTLIRDGYKRYNQLIEEIIAEGTKLGEFKSGIDAREIAKLISGMIDGLALQNLLVSSEKVEVSREVIFSVINNILIPCGEMEE